MRATGADVVIALASARKAVQLYPETHGQFERALTSVVAAVERATQEGAFELNLHQGRLYDGSELIPSGLPGVDAITRALEFHSVESLTFDGDFGSADALGLVRALSDNRASQQGFGAALDSQGVSHVCVATLTSDDEDARQQEEREAARRRDRALYQRLISALRTVSSQLSRGQSPDLVESTELVEGLLARLMEDRAAVMGLATIRGTGERALFHSLNVMIYSCVLGRRLGLSEHDLTALGTAALLHDIGKSEFDPHDAEGMLRMQQLHPVSGARLLRGLALNDPGPMLVAYEHHMNIDGSGFPDRADDYPVHPYSRMVAIADRYENLTNPPIGTPAMTPDRAMIGVLREASTAFDPVLARLFASAMGVFPVGCVVRLADDSVGVVREPTDDPLVPRVRLVYDSRGLELSTPYDVTLGAADVRIVEVIDPDSLAVQVADRL